MRNRAERYHTIRWATTDGSGGVCRTEDAYGYGMYGLTPEEAEDVIGFGGEFACGADFLYGDDETERMYIETGRMQYHDEFFRYMCENGEVYYD